MVVGAGGCNGSGATPLAHQNVHLPFWCLLLSQGRASRSAQSRQARPQLGHSASLNEAILARQVPSLARDDLGQYKPAMLGKSLY